VSGRLKRRAGELERPLKGDAVDLLGGLSALDVADLLGGLSVPVSPADLLGGLSIPASPAGVVVALGSGLGFTGSSIADFSSFNSITFQSFWKETIGRPGLSETMVGVGSFALRFLRLKPVAARNSSLRISLPSLILGAGSFSASDFASASGLGCGRLSVYAALRDCVGSLF
jgi:hypothetical protein